MSKTEDILRKASLKMLIRAMENQEHKESSPLKGISRGLIMEELLRHLHHDLLKGRHKKKAPEYLLYIVRNNPQGTDLYNYPARGKALKYLLEQHRTNGLSDKILEPLKVFLEGHERVQWVKDARKKAKSKL